MMRRSRGADTNPTEPSEAIEAERGSPSRRAGRGLGPFTGAQLTIIIVTFAVLLLVPIGAWAVSGSNAFVTDASTGAHANVSANALTIQPAAPKSLIARHLFDPGPSPGKVAAPSAGHALIVTTFVLDTWDVTTSGDGDFADLEVSASTDCSTAGPSVVAVNPAAVGATTIPLNPGLVIPAGHMLCATSNGGISTDIYVFGYEIPAASAPTGAAVRTPAADAASGGANGRTP